MYTPYLKYLTVLHSKTLLMDTSTIWTPLLQTVLYVSRNPYLYFKDIPVRAVIFFALPAQINSPKSGTFSYKIPLCTKDRHCRVSLPEIASLYYIVIKGLTAQIEVTKFTGCGDHTLN